MKADARPTDEKEALKWAIDHFSRHRDDLNRRPPAGMPPGSVDACVVAYLAAYREGDLEFCNMTDLVADAREDEMSFEILVELTAKLIEAGSPLSETLREFVVGFLRNPMKVKRRPGPSRLDFQYRDRVIEGAVWHIRDTWKFPATRNEATERASAASVVRDALEAGAGVNLTEKAVNKIWGERAESSRGLARRPPY
jgi:hypothetical protein